VKGRYFTVLPGFTSYRVEIQEEVLVPHCPISLVKLEALRQSDNVFSFEGITAAFVEVTRGSGGF